MFQPPLLQPAGPAEPVPAAPVPAAARASRIDDPRREIVAGAGVIGLFATATLVWAFLVPLDAAVVASGTVKVSGERQKVQSAGDGVISAIRIQDGDRVRAGQPLIEFAAPDLIAAERSLASRVISLQAEIAGLEAETAGIALSPPPAFGYYAGADAELAARALETERATLARRRDTASAERAVLRARMAQTRDQMSGTTAQGDAVRQQRALLDQEMDGIRTLAARGFASRNRVLEMERSEAELVGNSGNLSSELARLRSTEGETRMQMVQQDSDRQQTGVTRLRDARAELQALLPQWTAARAQLARMEVRAPVTGAVVGLSVHSVGGVTERGQTLLEIVPSERSLTIEAEVPATDGNDVSVGKTAVLRLPGIHGRNVPKLAGTVTAVAADTLVDERSGRSYYAIRVRVAPSELDRLAQAVGETGVLRPGNPVQVVIATRSRSALQYWLEPLTQTLNRGLHEK